MCCGVPITEADIRCSLSLCPRSREERIATAILGHLLDDVLRHAGIVISESEVSDRAARAGGGPEAIRQIAALSRTLGQASLRVLDGADADVVYESDVKPAGVTREAFDHFRSQAASRETLLVFLRRDHEEVLRRDLYSSIRWEMSLRELSRYLASASDDEQRSFWIAVFDITATTVHDQMFEPLDMKGALKRHEITIGVE